MEKRTESPDAIVRTGARSGEKWPWRLRCSSESVWITPGLLKLFQYLERMAVRLNEVPGLLHLAVGTDEERRADHTFTAAGSLAPCAVRVVDPAIGIGEEIEVEAVLLLKGLMRCGVVLRHAEHGYAET